MKNVLLIGAGRFGRHIAVQLSQLGHQVMAVDEDEERINDVLPFVTNAQIGDSTNTEFLRSLGIGNYDVCIVTIGGSFQNSLETTSLLKELGGHTDRKEKNGEKITKSKRQQKRDFRTAGNQMAGRGDHSLYHPCFFAAYCIRMGAGKP